MNKLSSYAPILVRFTVAAILLWFGFNQFSHPEMWTGIVPAWGASLFGSAINAVHFNAWFEVIGALVLLSGIYTRAVGLILAVHIGTIASGFLFGRMGFGLSPTAVRDFGLSLMALSIFFHGSDIWSLDHHLARRKASAVPNQQ